MLLDLLAGLRELDPSGLPASTNQDLRLHHNGVTERLGGLDRLGDRCGGPAVGYRNPVAAEELLALIFEEVHENLECAAASGLVGRPAAGHPIENPISPRKESFAPT